MERERERWDREETETEGKGGEESWREGMEICRGLKDGEIREKGIAFS